MECKKYIELRKNNFSKNDVNQASVLTILGNRIRRRENKNFIYEIFSQKNINQTIYLSIEPAIYQTTYLSIEPAIYQTTYLSIEPSIYRNIYLLEDGRKLIDGRCMELFRYNMGLSKGGSLGYELPKSNAMRRYRCQSQIYRLTLPMLRLLSPKAQGAKIVINHLNPIILVFIGIAMRSQLHALTASIMSRNTRI